MSGTIITMSNGSKWRPSSSVDKLQCHHCNNVVDTPEEVASYPNGTCPDCGKSWTVETKRHTAITVTAPEAILGEA